MSRQSTNKRSDFIITPSKSTLLTCRGLHLSMRMCKWCNGQIDADRGRETKNQPSLSLVDAIDI